MYYTTNMELSNASSAGLGAPNCLPPLFRRRLPLPCVVLRRLPLSRAAGRRIDSLIGDIFVRRVAQRGWFALGTGRVGVGWRWHGVMCLCKRRVVRRYHIKQARIDNRFGWGGGRGGWHVVIGAGGASAGGSHVTGAQEGRISRGGGRDSMLITVADWHVE